jgi:polyphosphate:AMP phosphotransferase
MFETVELGRTIDRDTYERELATVRAELLEAQFALIDRRAFPVCIVIAGVDGAGRSAVVNRLKEWFDVRNIRTHAFGRLEDTAGAASEPADHRAYWAALPARGEIALFFGSWYTDPLHDRVKKRVRRAAFERELARLLAFERTLADDGALVLKFWLHLSRAEQKRRLSRLEEDKEQRGRFHAAYWRRYRRYGRHAKAAELMIRRTDTGQTPWILIDAADDRYRDLTVARCILEHLRRRLDEGPRLEEAPAARELSSAVGAPRVLASLDLSVRADEGRYAEELAALQARIGGLAWDLFDARRSTVVVFEGWDAAGKGGVIRRLTQPIDARLVRVIAISAPNEVERLHHYLWRFWRQLPPPGHLTVYDRSWYGRVLVERVEGYAREPEWRRAYRELNEFEEHLIERDVVLAKFFLHIDADEQLRRFREREQVRHKQHKITAEDWRNREKWAAYEEAVEELIARTSTAHAPWTLVPANSKHFARLEVLRTLVAQMEGALR